MNRRVRSDPCAGTGAALVAITENSCSRRYGIELGFAPRSVEARTTLAEVIQGNAFDTKAHVESFSLLYLNPPYDFEVGEGKNQRMEMLFLEEFYRWLKLPRAYSRCDTVRPHPWSAGTS